MSLPSPKSAGGGVGTTSPLPVYVRVGLSWKMFRRREPKFHFSKTRISISHRLCIVNGGKGMVGIWKSGIWVLSIRTLLALLVAPAGEG